MATRFILPLLASLVVGCAASSEDPSSNPNGSPNNPEIALAESAQNEVGRVSVHGSVVVGTPSEAFLSHIPLFENPHDVQVIVAGSFVQDAPSSSASASAPQAPLPTSFSDKLFTFVPSAQFSLDGLRLGSLREIKGTIFVGNFEDGGRPVASRVRFVVSKVLHQHILDKNERQETLTYFLFGSRAATFAAHRIAASPSFDEMIRVDLGNGGPSDAELASGIEIEVTGKPDSPTNRLGIGVAPRNVTAGTRTFTIKPAKTLSCLDGPDFFTACN